jgi:hypothetical protein
MEELREAVSVGDFETVKALVDSKIVRLKRAYEYFIFDCEFDDPRWIEYLEPIYTTGDISRLNQAVARNKPKCALSLLKRGAYVNHRSIISHKIPIECAGTKQMVKLLIEYGSDRPSIEGALAKFATDVIDSRNHIRQCAIITLYAGRCRSRYCAKGGFADILQIIARCVWSARLSEFNLED